MSLFPIIQPQAADEEPQDLPLYREIAWDFKKGEPIFKAGEPVILEGANAVKTWIWKALITVRARYEIYSWDFGNELEELIGQPFTEELKRAEAARYVKEALEINPYITEITSVRADFTKGTMSLAATVETIYGEVEIYV